MFISFVFNTSNERDNLDQTFLHYHNLVHFFPVSPWQRHVGRYIRLLGLMKIFIFSQSLRTHVKNCRPIWSLKFISYERVLYVGTYKKKISVGTS